ncbi:MAG TPA: type II toxin-antitoxin system VapC family toxin [Pyrinomonadaceae bacterium]|nr:type II toxin-antitoxin system VapC family toxin [Pyrinomonadaceae bacterium]
MRTVFLDTSALVKRYVDEVGSEWVSDLFQKREDSFYIAELTLVEFTSAVLRRIRPVEAAQRILNDFEFHLFSDLIVLDITSDLIQDAQSIVRRHRLRAYDAVQLATAEELDRRERARSLPGVILVSADNEMLETARANGLDTENPNDHK